MSGRCEWEDSGPDMDGTSSSFRCVHPAIVRLHVPDIGGPYATGDLVPIETCAGHAWDVRGFWERFG